MDCTLKISSISLTNFPPTAISKSKSKSNPPRTTTFFSTKGCRPLIKISANSENGSVSRPALQFASNAVGDMHNKKSGLESLFCYDKAIPEEIIEKPIGLSLSEKAIGTNTRCTDCQAKGAVLCATCSGSGLYVDSIMESQGIIIKVRCLGCGGTGNIMCSECGGRGHLGHHA